MAQPARHDDHAVVTLTANLLGPFEVVRAGGEKVIVQSQRSRAILGCLAVETGNRWTRQRLAALLWEHSSAHQQRSSLRQELLQLRKSLRLTRTEDWADESNVHLPNHVTTDLALLRKAIAEGNAVRAASLWRGDLLQDINLPGKSFASWLSLSRTRLRKQVLGCLERALSASQDQQHAIALEDIAAKLVLLNPIHETAHRILMRCAAARGDVAAVVDRHHEYVAALLRRGKREPSPSIQQLLYESAAAASGGRSSALKRDAADWIFEINRQHLTAAAPAPASPPRIEAPSLAVVPFVDLSPGAISRAALADGLTEETTTAMARIPGVFVTARQSCMVYKSKFADVRTIASDLGVRYILEGSIEVQGKALHINARLIDGDSGFHLWGNSYDALVAEFFAVRKWIVTAVAAQLQPALMAAEIDRAFDADPENLDAWARLQRANGYVLFNRSAGGLSRAINELKQALAIDPDYAMARSLLAAVHTWRATWSSSPHLSREHAFALEHAARAREIEPNNSFVLTNCAECAVYSAGDPLLARQLLERAVEQNPADPQALALLANARRVAGGDPAASLRLIAQAKRISPRDPRTHRWLHYAGWCYWVMGDLKHMEECARTAIQLYSDSPAQWVELTCALGLQGKSENARAAAKVLRKLSPDFTPDGFYEIAQRFYGKRFTGSVKASYAALRATLQRAM
jgi:TolB-like protein